MGTLQALHLNNAPVPNGLSSFEVNAMLVQMGLILFSSPFKFHIVNIQNVYTKIKLKE
jgi:hypothetical protein